eukprot:Clim_evm72s109 gene=Clim_evmTU72s109
MPPNAVDGDPSTFGSGTEVWIPDNESVWCLAEVQSADGSQVTVKRKDDGEEVQIKLDANKKSLWPLLKNPDILESVDDLTGLTYLHEADVLHTLATRYSFDQIYTYSGVVLVAVNPFKRLPLYEENIMRNYTGKSLGELEPHVFAVAEAAFRDMEMQSKDQSIIVSGESGAGKTESAKYVMRYFAQVGGGASKVQIEKKVLASNPITEAFGNAKTTRNNNSSRFGKYLQINFDERLRISGAGMKTYLLELSRLRGQQLGERNYHIYYQLLSAANGAYAEEFDDFGLPGEASAMYYLNQGEAEEIEGVDDAEEFQKTYDALLFVGMEKEEIYQLCETLAGLLWIGNIAMEEKRNDAVNILEEDEALLHAARLLGVDSSQIRKWICKKRISTGRETVEKNLNYKDALDAKDALVKFVYKTMFDWIIGRINKALKPEKQSNRFIGVLDIYGFETFKVNSFEQFCINYANEKLQQMFNMHIFKLEQKEYEKEGINFSKIDFYDNQPCIEMIEGRLGVLQLLDEESKLPSGTDKGFAQKLANNLKDREHFMQPRMGAETNFIIKHYANDVDYTVADFVEKNRDSVNEDHVAMLRNSTKDMIKILFTGAKSRRGTVSEAPKTAAAGGRGKKLTVSSQFSKSLTELYTTLGNTTPHFVRCIKPNQTKLPDDFQNLDVVEQLRACGVLETIRISAAGFPSRWTYGEFVDRYLVLGKQSALKKGDDQGNSQKILGGLFDEDEDVYQLGKTKIFFRAGKVGQLERMRTDKLNQAATLVTKTLHAAIKRSRYLRIRHATICLQAYARGKLGREYAQDLRENKAATRIQKTYRMYVVRKGYVNLRAATIAIQAMQRGRMARLEIMEARRGVAIVKLQRWWRVIRGRIAYARKIRNITIVQNLWRRKLARRELGRLRAEARSLDKVQEKVSGLEMKVVNLQQQLTRKSNELNDVTEELNVAEKDREHLKTRIQEIETAAAGEQGRAGELADALEDAQDEIKKLQSDLEQKSITLEAIEKANEELKAELEVVRMNEMRARRITSAPDSAAADAEVPEMNGEPKEKAMSQAVELLAAQKELEEVKKRLEEESAAGAALREDMKAMEDTQNAEVAAAVAGGAMTAAVAHKLTHLESQKNKAEEKYEEEKAEREKYQQRCTKLQNALVEARKSAPVGNSFDSKLKDEIIRLEEETLELRAEIERLNNDLQFKSHQTSATTNGEATGPLSLKGETNIKPHRLSREVSRIHSPVVEEPQANGWFEFHISDIDAIVEELVHKVRFPALPAESPGIVAHIIFMCIRFADDADNEDLCLEWASTVMSAIKKQASSNDANVMCFWLANLCRLRDDLKLFSGDDDHGNSRVQSQALKNIDLSDLRLLISSESTDIIRRIVHMYTEYMREMGATAIMEYASLDDGLKAREKPQSPRTILFLWDTLMTAMSENMVDTGIQSQIIDAVVEALSFELLHAFFLQSKFCTQNKALAIKLNLVEIKGWLGDHGMKNSERHLTKVDEACQVLQIPKTIENVNDIRDLAPGLTTAQIRKLITNFKPESTSEKVPMQVITSFKPQSPEQQVLYKDIPEINPVIPYEPSVPFFPTIDLPACFSEIKPLLKKR